ncbi:hypothetical protein CQ10_17525 [Bradyrhizobium valentinum]|nr:hypothetical protein CQ10_17525 [Bradyrhizobium valentinum]
MRWKIRNWLRADYEFQFGDESTMSDPFGSRQRRILILTEDRSVLSSFWLSLAASLQSITKLAAMKQLVEN